MAEQVNPKNSNKRYFQAVGRRKESVARVRVLEGNGAITVNGKPIAEVFNGILYQKIYEKPFQITKSVGKFATTIKVVGGGQSSQLGAIVHGLSRALSQMGEEYKTSLKRQGLLTRDARAKERRKYGLAHKARAQKQSPKR